MMEAVIIPLLALLTPGFIKQLGWFLIGVGVGLLVEQFLARREMKRMWVRHDVLQPRPVKHPALDPWIRTYR